MDEQPKEDGEDFEDLSSVLEHLGLSEYKSTFDNEKIDIESFVSDSRLYCFTPLYLQRRQCFTSYFCGSFFTLVFVSHFPASLHNRGSEGDGNPTGSQEKDHQVCERESE